MHACNESDWKGFGLLKDWEQMFKPPDDMAS